MKKLLVFTLSLLLLVSVLSVISFADDEPVIRASGVSIRIPEGETKGGLRFKMTVEKPLPAGVEIIEEGTLILPLYTVEKSDTVAGLNAKDRNVHVLKDLTLDSTNVLKVTKTKNRYYTYTDSYYEFTAVLTGIPVYNLKSDICARGYIKYTVGGEEKVVYSDTVIYDIHSIAEKMVASNSESVSDKNAVETFIIDAHENYFNNDGGNAEGLLTITAPAKGEEVYPYFDAAIDYVNNGVLDDEGWDPAVPIEIKWENSYSNVASYTVLYATKSDFSDAKYAYASANASKVELFNLYKATTYYVKVIANLKDGTARSATSTFTMTDKGPRVMHLDGAYNMRDLGGYMTESDKRTLQGLIYRSGQFDGTFSTLHNYPTVISDYGKHTAEKELGIKTEFDFRAGDYTVAIPGAVRIHYPVGAYKLNTESYRIGIREAFRILADVNNYPIVFHCQGGADRTGTIAYFLLAILGVPEADVIRDYEFTTYSIYGERAIDSTVYIANPEYEFFEILNASEGTTLCEKATNFLLSIGVTESEIANIRSIMFTGDVERAITVPESVKLAESNTLNVGINGRLSDVAEVKVGGKAVKWTKGEGNSIVIGIGEFYDAESGDVEVAVKFSDGKTLKKSFTYDSTIGITVAPTSRRVLGEKLTVAIGAPIDKVKAIYVNDNKVNYVIGENNVVTIPFENVPSTVGSGEITVKVEFTFGTVLTGTSDYDGAELIALENIMPTTTLDSTTPSVTTSTSVGYGKWIKATMVATNESHGNIEIYIGSYGVRLFSVMRYRRLTETASLKEISGNYSSLGCANFTQGKPFDFYMKVDLVDNENVKVTAMKVNRITNAVTILPATFTRLPSTEEKPTTDAPVTISINKNKESDTYYTKTLVIQGKAS